MKKLIKPILNIAGIISGIVTLFWGIGQANSSIGMKLVKEMSYGGDAYTGMQNAGAATANNIKVMAELIQEYFSFVIILLGILLIIHFAKALCDNMKENVLLEEENK